MAGGSVGPAAVRQRAGRCPMGGQAGAIAAQAGEGGQAASGGGGTGGTGGTGKRQAGQPDAVASPARGKVGALGGAAHKWQSPPIRARQAAADVGQRGTWSGPHGVKLCGLSMYGQGARQAPSGSIVRHCPYECKCKASGQPCGQCQAASRAASASGQPCGASVPATTGPPGFTGLIPPGIACRRLKVETAAVCFGRASLL